MCSNEYDKVHEGSATLNGIILHRMNFQGKTMAFRLLFFVMMAAFLTACKIQIKVPTGGSVTNAGSTFVCGSGKTCSVDVIDLFFDETYSAKAESGFRFKNWKKKDRGLCGGANKPCHLFTSGFEGNSALMGFLERDEVFFLEPVFEIDNGEQLGTQASSVCFNPEMLAQGTTVNVVFNSTDKASGDVVRFRVIEHVMGQKSFGGRIGTHIFSEVSATGASPSESTTISYLEINLSKKQMTVFGVETELTSPINATSTATITPGILERFDLAAGESFSQSHTTTVTTTSQGHTSEHVENVERIKTYLGVDSVTVPAGTFDACKFIEQTTLGGNSWETTRWFGVGNGELIKDDDGSTLTELVSSEINGTSI